ncbi:biogenesis of lysosome-related organelles complex 1 subunit 1 isoform X1 [Brachyhypopomus gauderio]|uniref:biogenesis of lysosome-related organelles complex 1 subunit 1 isoform X1 n=1 Tax=Brachyhypopomus gauderio TaxID=698409 RepID=UPI0040429B3B
MPYLSGNAYLHGKPTLNWGWEQSGIRPPLAHLIRADKRRRREAIVAATCLTEALVDHLNVGVAQAYVNQRKLDHEVKTLQVQASQFAKQTAQWINMVEGFNQALKEIGDVENWARSIEMDMRTIATALEYVHKGHVQAASS